MDYWLGDSQLFPSITLNGRPNLFGDCLDLFLAWSPQSPFLKPDEIVDGPSGPIRFGSFNHNRKAY